MSFRDDPFVLSKQVELLYRNVRLGQIMSVLNASFLLWIASIFGHTSGTAYWWVAALLAAVLRIQLARKYLLLDQPTRLRDAIRWRQRALI
ncbi:MAG: hypothetical protein PHV02_21740, partial [Rhodocyclaceae bacterium]|nr:hypothetical protein [Rhodocyclaceae bacterium]